MKDVQAPSPGQLLVSVDQVAGALAISVRTVWRLVSAGHLPKPLPIPGTRARRWKRSDIEAFYRRLAGEQDGQKAGEDQRRDRDRPEQTQGYGNQGYRGVR